VAEDVWAVRSNRQAIRWRTDSWNPVGSSRWREKVLPWWIWLAVTTSAVQTLWAYNS
jgi:hypothetical protein